jgi:outer membrane lipoprotein LolB
MLTAGGLMSCAGLEPQPAATPPSSSIAAVAPPDRFELHGRISVTTQTDTHTGGFHWKHVLPVDEVWLFSPLGQGVAELHSSPAGVALTTGDKQRFEASDVEQLTLERLGWRLPLRGLIYWINASPHPESAANGRRDAQGKLETLEQDGWRLDYLQYHTAAPRLPRKLAMTRGDLEIRLVIDDWRLGD